MRAYKRNHCMENVPSSLNLIVSLILEFIPPKNKRFRKAITTSLHHHVNILVKRQKRPCLIGGLLHKMSMLHKTLVCWNQSRGVRFHLVKMESTFIVLMHLSL
ncbi:hypothetical protein F8388_023317, partial [Cannabis sativa]